MDNSLSLEFLDHVALRVRDLETSARWYETVLGLKRVHPEHWQPFPIMMMAGQTGIALFPAKLDDPHLVPDSRNVKIDHFAFRVDWENYEQARKRYATLGLDFYEEDHHYFHSLYTLDPDGHKVELTTLVQPFL